ncbi:hypothetical protein SAMN05216464_11037 [Mucilaginibacter pineti]|uniref:Restriction endonuclease n=1 Tax=Mucilaginibacter pineti TaxID=1391627 RepID=A0A1G7G9M2_9SPHI|nr:hypothetical protein [Mucilaginibacter pineti]SDE84811.1 hypothetical protein SAMN05216464_11037 [Mucilaginibacter pineti]
MPDYQLPPLNDPKLFESLICDLFNENTDIPSYKLFGKNGHQQKGIDIFSNHQRSVIQCKLKDLTRNRALLKREFFADVEDTINKLMEHQPTLSYDTLYIVTTLSEDPDFDEYCEAIRLEKGFQPTIIFWGWESIQKKLAKTKNTIKTYYPNFAHYAAQREDLIKYRVEMKQKIERDFGLWLNFDTGKRTRNSKMIIHSVDDQHYPQHVYNTYEEPQWFGAEISRLSHNGLGFVTGIVNIYLFRDGQWTSEMPLEEAMTIKTARIEVVAFEDIVQYDLNGDEHYPCPHFYCKFNHSGRPFVETYYQNLDEETKGIYMFFDDNTKRPY